MNRMSTALAPLALTLFAISAVAGRADGPPPPDAAPATVLASLVGEYELVSTFWPDPAAPPIVSTLPARRALILDGRALRLDVGPDSRGFLGTGMSGYDDAQGRFWYTWADTSAGGVAVLYGSLDASGSGRFDGHTPTPAGPAPLTVEVRREGPNEIHDYYSPAADGTRVRWLELRYQRR